MIGDGNVIRDGDEVQKSFVGGWRESRSVFFIFNCNYEIGSVLEWAAIRLQSV